MNFDHALLNAGSKKIIMKLLVVVSFMMLMMGVLSIRLVNLQTRPIIHTFEQKEGRGDLDLVRLWKGEWSKAGFYPKILTIADAKKHPYFKEMEDIVRPIFGDSYDAMNFYRWLAMASVGGGWMSECDTFPTNFPMDEGFNLPQGGILSSYETHVPALLSGTAEEWTRVSRLIIDAIPRIEGPKREMHILQALKDEGNSNVHFLSKFNVQVGLVYKSPHQVDCEKMGAGRAVHMAHPYMDKAFAKRLFPIEITGPGPAKDYRADAVSKFMDDWRYQCGGSNKLNLL